MSDSPHSAVASASFGYQKEFPVIAAAVLGGTSLFGGRGSVVRSVFGAANRPVFKLLGGRTKERIPVYASRLYSQPLDTLAEEARGYIDQGFR